MIDIVGVLLVIAWFLFTCVVFITCIMIILFVGVYESDIIAKITGSLMLSYILTSITEVLLFILLPIILIKTMDFTFNIILDL